MGDKKNSLSDYKGVPKNSEDWEIDEKELSDRTPHKWLVRVLKIIGVYPVNFIFFTNKFEFRND